MYAPKKALKRLSSTLQVRTQVHPQVRSQVQSQMHSMTLPASLTIRSQVSSQDAPKYTSEYILKYPPEHPRKDAPNCTRWHTPSLLDYTLPSMLSRTLPIALDDTLPAYLALRSQVHSQEVRHSQSHLTICSHVCCWVLDPETCWVASVTHRVAGGGWHMVAEIMRSVDIIVWILSLPRPPRRDLTMPHGHVVDNCSFRFCRKGRQLDLGESRSPTQIIQRNLLLASDGLWANVCAFGLGPMVTMAMVMMVMVTMSVMVIIVPETLRPAGWLCQR